MLAAFEDKGTLAKLFKESRVQKAAVSRAIDEVRGGEAVKDAGAEEQRQALEKYTDRPDRARQLRQARSGDRPRR